MTEPVKLEAVYDVATKRWRAWCPVCEQYFAARAKREAALHALSQHVAYEHGREPIIAA